MGEFDLSLIREFRSRPGFYDRNSPLFKDKVYNAREWQQIANKLGYDVSLLKDRMLQLRNRYNLEKRRLEQLHEENPGKHLESPWPLFEELTFLSEHIRARRSYKRLVPAVSTPQKFFGNEQQQLQQKMLQEQDTSQDPIDLLDQQQQLYNQQFFNSHAVMSPNANANLSTDAAADASHAAARFAANGLLTVKMEEEDADEDETPQQDYSEDNLDNLNGDGGDTDIDMTGSEAQQQSQSSSVYHNSLYQKQQQQQQQHQKRAPTSNNNMVISSISSKVHSSSSYQQPPAQSHKARRFYLPSINKHKPYQQQLPKHSHHHHHQQRQRYHHNDQLQQQIQRQKQAAAVAHAYSAATADYMASSVVDYAFMNKPRILSAREQKFVAFGKFVTSALLDLPQKNALLLLEKFTSEVVKGLLQKHNNSNHDNSNRNNSTTSADPSEILENSALATNMHMSGLGLTEMVNVPTANLSLLTNGDGSIEETH